MTPSCALVFVVWMAALGGCHSTPKSNEWFISGWDGQMLTARYQGYIYKAICRNGSIHNPMKKEGLELLHGCPHMYGAIGTTLPPIGQPGMIHVDGLTTMDKMGSDLVVEQWTRDRDIRWQEEYAIISIEPIGEVQR